MRTEAEASQERRARPASMSPSAGPHWLTPLYDLVCLPFGLGHFQRGIATRLALTGGERLLDVGCGAGTLLAEVKRRFPGVAAAGIDPDPAVLRVAGRRLARQGWRADLRVARAEALPFPDASFDVVVITLVLHHLPTPAKRGALREAHRALRPGGRCLVVDFGARPDRKVPWWQRLFEPVEYLEDNVHGRLPAFIAEAGLVNVRCVHRHWPAMEYLVAEKQ